MKGDIVARTKLKYNELSEAQVNLTYKPLVDKLLAQAIRITNTKIQ